MPKRLKRVQRALWEKASAFHWGMTIIACLGLPLGLGGIRGREADFSATPRTVGLSVAPVAIPTLGDLGGEMTDCWRLWLEYRCSGAVNQRALTVSFSG